MFSFRGCEGQIVCIDLFLKLGVFWSDLASILTGFSIPFTACVELREGVKEICLHISWELRELASDQKVEVNSVLAIEPSQCGKRRIIPSLCGVAECCFGYADCFRRIFLAKTSNNQCCLKAMRASFTRVIEFARKAFFFVYVHLLEIPRLQKM